MPNEAIEIRRARAEDVEQLWPLVQDFATSFRPERSAFDQTFTEVLDRVDTLVLVAVADLSTIVGYLLGSYHGTFFANGTVAWIEELMVNESVRGQGVASKLVSSAEEWARRVPSAYLALASRRGRDFYLRNGYEDSATFFRKVLATSEG
jgi:GNAT superfamily N-acetyltransferase